MNRTIGLVTTNYNITGFGELSEQRAAASIPFGGRYRLMDFALSNLVNSRIQTVGLITPYYYRSILDHVGAGKEWGLDRKDGGLYVLPGSAYGFRDTEGRFLFRDFMRNLTYFQRGDGDYILASSGTLVCNIDYQPMIARHELTGDNVTLLCRRTKPGEKRKGYYVNVDEEGHVTGLGRAEEGEVLFLDSFIIDRSVVLRLARDFANMGHLDLMDIISLAMGGLHIGTYAFDGYVADMGSAAEYLKASMELQDRDIRRELFNPDRQIFTKVHDTAPALYADGSRVRSSMVASGSIIEGEVENSVVFRSARIEKGAVVKNSVIYDKCVIKSGVRLENVICDRSATVTADTVICGTPDSPCILPKGGVI